MQHKILLVDDNQHLRESVKLYLRDKGFEVKVACDVMQAIQYLEVEIPDVIITDVVMPEKNGYDLINHTRSNDLLVQIPIIMLTAKGMTTDRIKGYDQGCSAYLSKPFDPNELVSIIKSLILKKSPPLAKKTLSSLLFSNRQMIKRNFTPREISVLQLVIRGSTNKDIAKVLHTSKRNVEKYVSQLLSKTQTRNRTELAQYILRDNIIDVD